MSRKVRLDIPGEEWRLRLAEVDPGKEYEAVLSHETLDTLVRVAIDQTLFNYYGNICATFAESYTQYDAKEELLVAVREKLSDMPVVLAITGRSGSGKTWLARDIMRDLARDGISTELLSTDDYNHGAEELERRLGRRNTNWDAAYVYDTALLASHIEQLKRGEPIPRHEFNFAESEPHVLTEGDMIKPARVIILEGIMANSSHFSGVADVAYVVPTPLATCIGRRVDRDVKQNRAGAVGRTPKKVLLYQLETAEPEYISRL